jgi:multiple sugar transport system permease protein
MALRLTVPADKSRKRTRKRLSVGTWIALVITAIISLWPLYWLLVSAVTPTFYTMKPTPDLLPVHFSLENFQRLLSDAKYYWNWMGNSLVVALSITLFHIFFDTLAGYAFAKKRFPGRTIIFWALIATMMVPAYVTVIPLYLISHDLHLLNTLWAIILPGMASAFGIFLMRQYIQTLPTELLDAARIDGCSEWGIFMRVVLPLCKPAIGALAIFTFVQHWNDFFWPLIAMTSTSSYTLTVGVASLQGEFTTDFGIIFAGATLAALPMIMFFFIFQRSFLEGVRMGALKG